VSQLSSKGIVTSFNKIGCALLDTDDGTFLLAKASITPGGLYVIPNAVHNSTLGAHVLAATVASSSSQFLASLSKEMQFLWQALLGHVRLETVRRAPHTDVTSEIDMTSHTESYNFLHLPAAKGIAPAL
jgi:hypothetical protein